MEVVDLVRRDPRSLEDCESSVAEDALIRLPSCPVLACHIAVVGSGSSPGETVTVVVGTHSVEATATCQLSFEVINAGEFDIGRSWLIVIAVLIEPRNWVRAQAAVRRFVALRNRGSTLLLR